MVHFSRKTKIALLICLVCLVGVGWYFLRQPVAPPTIEVAVIRPAIINKPSAVSRGGQLIAATASAVYADYSGTVEEVFVADGQDITAGQALLRLKAAPQAQAPTVTMPTADNGKIAALEQEHARLKKLYELGAIPRRQLENAAARLQDARNAPADTPIAAPPPLTPFIVNAPIGGIVTGLTLQASQPVQAGQMLLRIGSGQSLEAAVRIEQHELSFLTPGDTVSLGIEQDNYPAKIIKIMPDGAEKPSFQAILRLDLPPTHNLQPAMPVKAMLNVGESTSVCAVPTAALHRDKDGQVFAWTAENNQAALTPVQVGVTIGDMTEITDGLSLQSNVIISDTAKLTNGITIETSTTKQ